MIHTVDVKPTVLRLADLHPRIAAMILEVWRHQEVITAYQTGSLVLHFNGDVVKPQADKLALNSCRSSRP